MSPRRDAWFPSARSASPDLIDRAICTSARDPRTPGRRRCRPGCADVRERVGLELAKTELLRERERLEAGLDRLVAPTRQHQEPRRLRVELRFRPRRPGTGEQLARVRQARERRVVARREPVRLGEQHLGLGGALVTALPEQTLEGARNERELAALSDEKHHLRLVEHDVGPARVVLRRQGDGALEELRRRAECAQTDGPLARLAECTPCVRLERRRVLTRGPGELERCVVVVRDHARAVGRAIVGERLDPLGRPAVPLGTTRARDLRVRDVAHEDVPERVLGVGRDGATTVAADELLPLELVEPVLDRRLVDAAEVRERPGPEDLADHRCVLDQELLVGRKPVEPGGDDPLDRLGERQPPAGRRAPCGHTPPRRGGSRRRG